MAVLPQAVGRRDREDLRHRAAVCNGRSARHAHGRGLHVSAGRHSADRARHAGRVAAIIAARWNSDKHGQRRVRRPTIGHIGRGRVAAAIAAVIVKICVTAQPFVTGAPPVTLTGAGLHVSVAVTPLIVPGTLDGLQP